MANAILYNQGSHPTGALKSGTMSMNVSPSLNVGALKWRNGFENNNMWVIYSDTYSQGQATQGNALPTIWASSTFTDAGLVNLINTLPARAGQIPFTNITAATSWLFSQGVYFLSNQNYPQIVTSGMSFMLDAGFSVSYPGGTGTTWYNPSGVGNDFMLNNGVLFTNSATNSYFNFDGTDDNAKRDSESPSFSGTYDFTIEAIFNATTVTGDATYGRGIVSRRAQLDETFSIKNGQMYLTRGQSSSTAALGGTINADTWYHVVGKGNSTSLSIYINGVLATTASNTTAFSGVFLNWYIGTFRDVSPITNSFFYGKINLARLYSRELSQSEILQNYYKGPVVTSGLTIMLDAGNIVSYGGTGTSWKDLTNNGNNMNMLNGMVYNQTNGGELYMDGGDEYLQIPPSTNLGNLFSANSFTITVIAKSDNDVYPRSRCPIYVNGTVTNANPGQSVGWSAGHTTSNTSMEIRCGDGTNTNVGYVYHTVQQSTVYHRTFVIDRTNGVKTSYYVNGVLQGSLDFTNITGPIYTGTGSDFVDGFVFGNVWGWRFIGGVYNIMVHNRALSANEVQQNYNAQRGRFGI